RIPSITLCPYTTLFRSRNGYVQCQQNQKADQHDKHGDFHYYFLPLDHSVHEIKGGATNYSLTVFYSSAKQSIHRQGAAVDFPRRDRKSTRLNSSHVSTS